VAKSAASTNESRCQRIESCLWCGDTLPITSRSDTKYCCDQHRYYAAVDRGHSGKVSSVRLLKNGKISVVIYMGETDLRPGQPVKVGLDV